MVRRAPLETVAPHRAEAKPLQSEVLDGPALVYCQGAFGTTNGKTAHGLVRRTRRYRVLGVIDSHLAGQDAGLVLDGRPSGIPIFGGVEEAVSELRRQGEEPRFLVIGLAPDGGRLGESARRDVLAAIRLGLNIDSGLHDFLCEDPEIVRLAEEKGVRLRDIRKPPPRSQLHFFSGKIREVTSFRVAVLGTDSAVGKRTTAWLLTDALNEMGVKAEFVGTGQTAWMQGARFCVILDSLVNDFVSGEIEHAVWSAWNEVRPEVIVIEGQGSLLNPAYPGGFEILAAARPDAIILQHAPARREYDGFPGYPIHPLNLQIELIEKLSGKPVVALSINHEGLAKEEVPYVCRALEAATGLPALDVLLEGASRLADVIRRLKERSSAGARN
ncbi:MAG: DUF1611 domain-containing protein [candidate division KSB1 bacterium]|nr:DUF1611 domain-containing protein [candidate division KSB1 bacterium]